MISPSISKIGLPRSLPTLASKDANHQGQNSHAPFQGREDLTPQLVQLQQRPANPHALTLDEHASRAKAATSTLPWSRHAMRRLQPVSIKP